MVTIGKLMEDGLGVPFDQDLSRQQGEGGAALEVWGSHCFSSASDEGERKEGSSQAANTIAHCHTATCTEDTLLSNASHLLNLSSPFVNSTRC